MRKRARFGLFDRLMERIFASIVENLIESLPIVGPMYKAIKMFNKLNDFSRACAVA